MESMTAYYIASVVEMQRAQEQAKRIRGSNWKYHFDPLTMTCLAEWILSEANKRPAAK